MGKGSLDHELHEAALCMAVVRVCVQNCTCWQRAPSIVGQWLALLPVARANMHNGSCINQPLEAGCLYS